MSSVTRLREIPHTVQCPDRDAALREGVVPLLPTDVEGSTGIWRATPRAATVRAAGRPRMLRQLDENLWVVARPLRFWGLEVGCRMTVIRLADGSLFLHSPVALEAPLRAALDALGPVRHAVAPNRLHHLHAGDVTREYPAARLWIAAGLEAKRPDLTFTAILTDDAPPEWNREIDQRYFAGRPFENEVIFLHRASRTLIACDTAFNFGDDGATPWMTRLVTRVIGAYGRFGPSAIDGLLIRDRAAARRSLEQILAWDFDRVVVSHGAVLPSGGRDLLRASYAWLLDG
jgi:hypothetical protein